ncbi:MAG TPA: hypothetical protein EYF95_04990 [Flavobacteriales bacterium]|nr:hypothetical protein [Flavobacteriales bacterium]
MARLQKISIIIVLLLLNAPWLSDVLGFKEPHPLHGESTIIEEPEFSFDNLWSGEFQTSVDDFSRTNFLLRGMAIRTRNEIDYSMFCERHAKSVIAGSEGYLFEENYVLAALGLDAISEDTVSERVSRLSELSMATGVPFLFVLAPGKGSYFREFLPKEYLQRKEQSVNRMYEMWLDQLVLKGLRIQDLNSFFRLDKEVFPKNGIHWSEWAQVDAINIISDALLDILPDSLRPARLMIDSSYRSTIMEGSDDDIEQGLNLWRNIPDLEATYYNTHWEDVPAFKRPRILVIADSYAWGLVNKGLLRDGYRDSEFWFYNKGVHGPNIVQKGASPQTVHGFSTKAEFEQVISGFDAVVLLSTDANLPRFPFNFGNNVE